MPWQLNGDDISVLDWQFRAGQLTLSVRIHTADTEFDAVRDKADRAGDWSTINYSDGRREIVDQTSSPSPVTIRPPDSLLGDLIEDRYFVKSFTERPGSGGSLYYDATIGLHRQVTRAPQGASGTADRQYGRGEYGDYADSSGGGGQVSQSPGSTDWFFGFEHGEIAVPKGRVQGGEQRAKTTSFRLKLTPTQGSVLLDTLGTTDAVMQQRVADGDDYYIDNHPRDRNTVRVTPPADGSADDYLGGGDYCVTDWRVSYDESQFWAGELAIALLSRTAKAGLYGGSRWGRFNYGNQ